MPTDVAVQLYITPSPPMHGFLSSYEDYRARNLVNGRCKPLRPCINTGNSQTVKPKPNLSCRVWPGPENKAKKKVVFADSRGMSLTAVRVFCPAENQNLRSEPALQFRVLKLEGTANDVQSRVLDFKQPSVNYINFRTRLMKNSVCLESCMLQGRALTGTVKVRNLAFEKSVHVRITYDSWESHEEVACAYMNDVYGRKDVDTFSFIAEIPAFVPPRNKAEFCVSYATRGQTYWDNNNGKNYALVTARGGKIEKGLFEQISSKKCNRFSAECKHWINIDASAPYW